jgi:hypothetical protein
VDRQSGQKDLDPGSAIRGDIPKTDVDYPLLWASKFGGHLSQTCEDAVEARYCDDDIAAQLLARFIRGGIGNSGSHRSSLFWVEGFGTAICPV